jgi:hypothetical protein
MGEQAFTGSDTRAPQLSITDPKVCRSYLVGNCPHDLFTNTKQDFGPCPNVHNEALKVEYQEAPADKKRQWGFEFDYLRDMQKYVGDCDRRIDQAQRRLEKTPDEIRQTNSLVCTSTPRVEDMLTLRSLNRSTNSPSPSKPAYSRSRSWARRVKSTWPSPSSSGCARRSRRRRSASAISSHYQTQEDLQDTRSFKCAMFAVPISAVSTMIADWQTTSTERCISDTRRCASRTTPYKKSSRDAPHRLDRTTEAIATWTARGDQEAGEEVAVVLAAAAAGSEADVVVVVAAAGEAVGECIRLAFRCVMKTSISMRPDLLSIDTDDHKSSYEADMMSGQHKLG